LQKKLLELYLAGKLSRLDVLNIQVNLSEDILENLSEQEKVIFAGFEYPNNLCKIRKHEGITRSELGSVDI
jgi:hypothetical protein